jgi:hypothetical protein
MVAGGSGVGGGAVGKCGVGESFSGLVVPLLVTYWLLLLLLFLLMESVNAQRSVG